MRGRREWIGLAIGACLSATAASEAGGPPNDTCATAIVANNGANLGDNIGATTTVVNSCGSPTGNNSDVWWVYTAPGDGDYEFNTSGSALSDTVLSAWSACSGSEIACNDDGVGLGTLSRIVLTLETGTTVWLSVSDWGPQSAVNQDAIQLNILKLTQPGACCLPDGTCEVLSVDACEESGGEFDGGVCDPDPCPPPTGACCLEDGSCEPIVEADCDAGGGDYQGNGVTCSDAGCPQPPGACCAANGTCEFILEAACNDAGGYWLGFGSSCDPNPCVLPENDECFDAIDLGPLPAEVNAETCLASTDETEPCGDETSPGRGVWYTVTGNGNQFIASTCKSGTDFDTNIQVFIGFCNDLICIGGNDDAPGMPPECSLDGFNRFSKFAWASYPGETYYIHVGGFSTACGNVELNVSEGPPPLGRCCYPGCAGDTNNDGQVNVDDLVAVILGWGPCESGAPCPADTNDDGVVDVDDLVAVILNWGMCAPLQDCAETTVVECIDLGGIWDVGLDCDEPCPPPVGACCLENGTCALLEGEECLADGGIYSGDFTDCEMTTCPPPSNDSCADAIDLGGVPVAVVAATCQATDDDTDPCGLGAVNQGVWYTITGTGESLTATTCNAGSDFDTTMKVFLACDGCDDLVCVDGNDDDFGCEFTPVRSTVTWCSARDQVYVIHVGGLGTTCGDFELTVSESGPCADPPLCP